MRPSAAIRRSGCCSEHDGWIGFDVTEEFSAADHIATVNVTAFGLRFLVEAGEWSSPRSSPTRQSGPEDGRQSIGTDSTGRGDVKLDRRRNVLCLPTSVTVGKKKSVI